MVLADDDSSTLRAGIEEGRRAYRQPRQGLPFVLPTSIGQALIVAVAVLAFPAGDLPVSPVQILWINLTVAVALALPLAFEAPEPDVMSQPPWPPGTPLLDHPLLGGIRELAWAAAAAIMILPVAGLRKGGEAVASRGPRSAPTRRAARRHRTWAAATNSRRSWPRARCSSCAAT
jgi:magnesium-transporting ATPase (P-type)